MGATDKTITRNQLIQSGPNAAIRYKQGTILTGRAAAFLAGTVLMLGTDNKYVEADSDTLVIQASTTTLTNERGWAILLENADAQVADADAKIAVAGECYEDDLIFVGATLNAIDENAKAILAMNNLFVNVGTNAMNKQ